MKKSQANQRRGPPQKKRPTTNAKRGTTKYFPVTPMVFGRKIPTVASQIGHFLKAKSTCRLRLGGEGEYWPVRRRERPCKTEPLLRVDLLARVNAHAPQSAVSWNEMKVRSAGPHIVPATIAAITRM